MNRLVFENTYFTFSDFKKHNFTFFEMTFQKVVKRLSQKFSPQCVEMSSHTSLSDCCNISKQQAFETKNLAEL